MKQVITPNSSKAIKNAKTASVIENAQKKKVKVNEADPNWKVEAIPYNEENNDKTATVEEENNLPAEETEAAEQVPEKADWVIYSVTLDPNNMSASGVLVPQLVSAGSGAYSSAFSSKLFALGVLSGVGLLGWSIMDRDSATYRTTGAGNNKQAQENPTQDNPAQENPTQNNPTQENPTQENPTQENPTQNNPAQENPTQENPTQENPAQENPTEENPTQNNPTQENPTQENPAQENPTQENPDQDNPTQDNPTQENPTQENPTQENPAQENSTEENPTQNNPAQENPAQENPTQENPTEENPAQENPTQENPTQENPTQENPTQENPAQENPTQENPTQENPAQENPTEENPAQENPTQENPDQENPTQENPTQENPTQENPAQENPTEENPTQNNPAQENPTEENPAQENPTQENPTEENPAQDNPTQGNPTQENPAQENPTEENPTEENPAQDNPTQENPTEENPAQDNPTQGNPTQENPTQDNPAQENPTQEDPAQENPAQDNPTQGNPAQENPTQVTPPVVPKVLPQPEIVINSIASDNIINNVEIKEQITISGTVTNAKTNDSLTLKIGNTTLTATVQADGKFSTTTSGSVLESSREIVASITTRDNEGNQATGTKIHQYDVITDIIEPTITLNNITYDNVLDIAEKEYEEITLSGTVKEAKTNDIVTLNIGTTTITTHVQDNGTFSVETSGAVLATSQNIIASVTTQDSIGNQATATTTHEYRHSDFVPVRKRPSIQFIKVTEDNILNANEAKQDEVEIKVSVAFTEPDDVVTLKIGDISLATTKEGDYYKATTSGDIVANGKGSLLISITGYDHTGYQFTQETPYEYYVMTTIPQPVIQFDDITDHNSINLAESKLSDVVVSGTATNTTDGDNITIQIGNETFNTEVKNERFSITTSGQILAKNSKITASLTTTDIAGNQAAANTTHDYQVLPVYSTKVTYPNEVLSYESNEPFDFSTLKYTLEDPQSYVLQNSEAKAKVIAALEQYVQANPDLAAQNITASYKADSDGDGIIDIYDKNPQMWNVSERDLRFFATAAHSSENVNKNIFERYNNTGIDAFNTQRMDNGADIREINKQWEVLKYVSAGEDLQYFIYGNGKNEDGSYQNVVIAFRGSNSSTDWQGNLKLLSGEKHPQLKYIDQAAEYVAAYNPENLYAAGNSLGGYLAQYFAAYTVQHNSQLAPVFRHSSLFNPAILKTGSGSPSDLKEAKETTDQFVKQSITDDSDLTHPVSLHKTDSYVINGEFVSSGYSILGMRIGGLGSYENTTFFNGTGSSTDKHKMTQFYANNQQLEDVFSRGYRMDTHYTNKDSDNDGLTDQQEARLGTKGNEVDSDGDGFSDKLEAQLKSDPLNANTIPDFLDKINIQEVFASIAVTIESQSSQGGSKAKNIELAASLEGNDIVYTLEPAVAAEYTSDFIL